MCKENIMRLKEKELSKVLQAAITWNKISDTLRSLSTLSDFKKSCPTAKILANSV